MHALQFLSRVLAAEGHYCLWALDRSTGTKKQTFYASISELATAALEYDARGWDAYFGTATFSEPTNRTASNAHMFRTFFLDLDCGEGKDYPDQITALHSLRDFCMRMALPKPLIVNSGYGVHVYWVLDRDVTKTEWLPVAEKLKAAAKQHNFPMDSAVPADAARILRVPETRNYKADQPMPVAVLAKGGTAPVSFEEFAGKFGEIVSTAPKPYIPAKHRAVTQQLISNQQSNFKSILTRSDPCAQLIHAVTRQEEIDEPLWRATLSVAVHCADADKAIHAVSRGHPEYDPHATEEKARRIKGPYLCSRFDEYNPGVCAQCPHFGQIKSPIVLGRELKVAETEEERTVELPVQSEAEEPETVVIPKPPAPYVRGANGGVYRQQKDEEGNTEDILIYHHDLYVKRRVYDPDEGEFVLMCLHLPQDGMREFSVPQASATSADELRKILASKGVTAKTKSQWEKIGYYIMDSIEDMQSKQRADNMHRQFGWTEGMASFVVGTREYYPGGVRLSPANRDTRRLAEAMEPQGTLEEWKELMQFFNREGMELHQLIICTAFGSPLMEFSPIYAMLLHLDGPTGFGKTTTQWAAAGVYGRPDTLMIRHDDTTASKFNRFDVMKNLPIYIDELTKCKPDEASSLAYTLSAGSQRNRMSSGSNNERRRGRPWHLCAVSSGNASVVNIMEAGKANTDAENERVFEVNISEYIYPYPKAEADAFQNRILNDVYGVAAEPYIQWLVDNRDDAKAFFKKTQERLDAASGLTSTNRMISASFAAYLAGGMIAKKLGLIDFDMKRLFDTAVKMIRDRAEDRNGSKKDSVEYLMQYITENWNNILRINSSQDARELDPVVDQFVVPDATPRGELVARWEPDRKKLFVIPKPFRRWCAEQQLNHKAVMEAVGEKYNVTYSKVRIDKGTKMNLSPIGVYVIDFPLEDQLPDGSDTPQ